MNKETDETREEVEAWIVYFKQHADAFAAAHRNILSIDPRLGVPQGLEKENGKPS
jgi:hypothetical protein